MDLTEFSRVMYVPLGAVAGMNYLRHFGFELDPQAEKIRSVQSPVMSARGIAIKISWHYRTTINFPENTVWLERLTSDNEIWLPASCQAPDLIFDETSQLMVAGSIDGFRLADHGLAEGDQVTAINGISSSELSVWKVNELLSASGTTVSLEVQRAEKRFTTKIRLQRSFKWPPPPRWSAEPPEFNPESEAALK
jgi:hypothetical protein